MIIEQDYTWNDIANFMADFGIPNRAVRDCSSPLASVFVYDRPVLDIIKFDDYLHYRFGNYEEQGKSQADVFNELFGDKVEQAKYYFGVD